METIELIRRAIHCDNTNQPRMTELYIKRALETNAADRELIRRQRAMLEAARLAQPIIRDIFRAVEEIWPAIVAGMNAIGEAAQQAGEAIARALEPGVKRNPTLTDMFGPTTPIPLNIHGQVVPDLVIKPKVM